MEPRLFRHGNIRLQAMQWSIMTAVFQLSHVFSDMEMSDCTDQLSSYARCFNGATSFQTWKLRMMDSMTSECKFQLGHVFSDMEIR